MVDGVRVVVVECVAMGARKSKGKSGKAKPRGKPKGKPTGWQSKPPPPQTGDENTMSYASLVARGKMWKEKCAEKEMELQALRLATLSGPVVDVEGGVVTAERMRKVMAQDSSIDVGPTEKRLREWLDRDVKGYMTAADEREKEERLARRSLESVVGSEKVEGVAEEWLKEWVEPNGKE